MLSKLGCGHEALWMRRSGHLPFMCIWCGLFNSNTNSHSCTQAKKKKVVPACPPQATLDMFSPVESRAVLICILFNCSPLSIYRLTPFFFFSPSCLNGWTIGRMDERVGCMYTYESRNWQIYAHTDGLLLRVMDTSVGG